MLELKLKIIFEILKCWNLFFFCLFFPQKYFFVFCVFFLFTKGFFIYKGIFYLQKNFFIYKRILLFTEFSYLQKNFVIYKRSFLFTKEFCYLQKNLFFLTICFGRLKNVYFTTVVHINMEFQYGFSSGQQQL
jgi:hypothetical protein